MANFEKHCYTPRAWEPRSLQPMLEVGPCITGPILALTATALLPTDRWLLTNIKGAK